MTALILARMAADAVCVIVLVTLALVWRKH